VFNGLANMGNLEKYLKNRSQKRTRRLDERDSTEDNSPFTPHMPAFKSSQRDHP